MKHYIVNSYQEEQIFHRWLVRNKLIGQIYPIFKNSRGKVIFGLIVPMDFILAEYEHVGGGMYLTRDVLRTFLKSWKVESYGILGNKGVKAPHVY